MLRPIPRLKPHLSKTYSGWLCRFLAYNAIGSTPGEAYMRCMGYAEQWNAGDARQVTDFRALNPYTATA